MLALDFEVAHWGDPAFDAAFMLTHLLAKAVHRRDHGDGTSAAAREFWRAYGAEPPGAAGRQPGGHGRRVGVLLLCRVDGSPSWSTWAHEQRELVRRFPRA